MFPIMFRIGNIAIRSYTVLLDLGILAGLALAYGLWRRRQFTLQSYLDHITCALLGGIIGGRIAYVGANWAYFSEHWTEALAIWKGGLSFHGAFVGGCLAVILYVWLTHRPFWPAADILSAGLSLASIFGWLACFLAGCAYGIVGRGVFFLVSPDIYGIEAPRFALQLAGAIQSAVLLGILLIILRQHLRPGTAFSVYLALYFGGQFALEFLRGDETIFLGSWRVAHIVEAISKTSNLCYTR